MMKRRVDYQMEKLLRQVAGRVSRLPLNLIRIRGTGTYPLLQGLITNDVNTFNAISRKSKQSIYSFLLSLNGRVLFDSILYNMTHDVPEIWIEAQVSEVEALKSHLLKYRMRKKV